MTFSTNNDKAGVDYKTAIEEQWVSKKIEQDPKVFY